MTETAKRADVIFPAASAYEKEGTVTNVTGEVQQLKRALKTMGTKPDLEIFGSAWRRKWAFATSSPPMPHDGVRTRFRKMCVGIMFHYL